MAVIGYGWAVHAGGQLRVNTVSTSRRAAIVNWLAIDRAILITIHHTDVDIERLWEAESAKDGGATAMQVEIKEKRSG